MSWCKARKAEVVMCGTFIAADRAARAFRVVFFFGGTVHSVSPRDDKHSAIAHSLWGLSVLFNHS